ncbi:MAG: alpha/beta hydrolase [Flavisolibacter sp.]|nr:alpha/beta hydrolase [Flavisolibacter sp.]
MQEKNIQVNHKNIFLRTSGTGPVVVLLHGFGEDGRVWKHQYNSIPGFRFIVPDLPGSGRSEMVDDTSMEAMADLVKAIIDREVGKDEKLVVIGHSMGGYITLAFAEKYQERLLGFGLFHSTAFADSDEKKMTRQKGIRFIEENGPESFLKTMIPNLYGPMTKPENAEKIQYHLSLAHNFSGAALVSYYMSMMQRPDRTSVLRNAGLPVMILMGRFDQAIPMEESLKLAYMADISYIHMLDKSGHMGMVEEESLTNDLLTNYLTRMLKTTQPG